MPTKSKQSPTPANIADTTHLMTMRAIPTREDLEQLLYGRQRNTSAVRDIVGRADLAPLRCEVDEDHRAVVRQFTDAKHMGPS